MIIKADAIIMKRISIIPKPLTSFIIQLGGFDYEYNIITYRSRDPRLCRQNYRHENLKTLWRKFVFTLMNVI